MSNGCTLYVVRRRFVAASNSVRVLPAPCLIVFSQEKKKEKKNQPVNTQFGEHVLRARNRFHGRLDSPGLGNTTLISAAVRVHRPASVPSNNGLRKLEARFSFQASWGRN